MTALPLNWRGFAPQRPPALAWPPPAECTPSCAAAPAPQVSPARRIARATAIIGVLLFGVVVALVSAVSPAAVGSRLISGWARWLLRAIGVRLSISGGERTGSPLNDPDRLSTFVVSNHVSWMDTVVLLAVQPTRQIAKREIGGWPLIGWLARRGGTIFLDRTRLTTLSDTVEEVTTALRAGHTVSACPEATTRCGRRSGHFYPALFQSVIDADASVRPVAIRYRLRNGDFTARAAYLGDESLVASTSRTLAVRGLVVEVHALPAIAATGITDRRVLAHRAQRAIAELTDGPHRC